MAGIYEQIVQRYGYNEPIFTNTLKEELDLKPNTFRQTIKRLSDKGLIKKVTNGIYFVPDKNSVLSSPILSVDKIIDKKFLQDSDGIVGYKTGINFANSLGLTSQTASVTTIVTNKTASVKRDVTYYNKKIIIRKPKKEISTQNYKVLQVLDLLNDYEKLCEEPMGNAKIKILNYLKDVKISEADFKECLKPYPDKTKVRVYESEIDYEITRR
ncbi:DUF6088 family protein [Marinilactibacillus kalidii]|uniref:DUF6088 family protein n=1 Tax=Marinilactibacillus kalidii TaxID=2820274 RepID=UPI001ABE391A|nr:DUF6088 family protein [Marinilactibacillus kalidii]